MGRVRFEKNGAGEVLAEAGCPCDELGEARGLARLEVDLPEIVLRALAGGEAEALAVRRPRVGVAVAEDVVGVELGDVLDFAAAGRDQADVALVEVVHRTALRMERDALAVGRIAGFSVAAGLGDKRGFGAGREVDFEEVDVEDVFGLGRLLDSDGGALAVGGEGVGEDVAFGPGDALGSGAGEGLEPEAGVAVGFAVDFGIRGGRVIGGEVGEGGAVGGPGVGVDGVAEGLLAEDDFAVGEIGEQLAIGGPAGPAGFGDQDGFAAWEIGAMDFAVEDVGVGLAVGAELGIAEGGEGHQGFDGPDRRGDEAKQGCP